MSGINIGEIGTPLRINVNEDISAATSVLIIAQPEAGTKKECVFAFGWKLSIHNGRASQYRK